MFTNIIYPKSKQKTKLSTKVYSDIYVECIVYELSDFDEILKNIRTQCQALNLMFITRKFNSTKYSNDRNYITKLPAFHIHIKDQYRNTFFLNPDPINLIKMEMSLYADKLKEQKRLIEERDKYFSDLWNRITFYFRCRIKPSN
jgi:hypothetical protein